MQKCSKDISSIYCVQNNAHPHMPKHCTIIRKCVILSITYWNQFVTVIMT